MRRTIIIKDKNAPALFRLLGESMKREAYVAEVENAQDALQTARALSSGPYSTRDLRLSDHPYAKRHGLSLRGKARPALGLDPAIINYQEGNFYRGWAILGPRRVGGPTGGNIVTRLTNEWPKSRFMFDPNGTRYMVPRPILQRIVKRISARVRRRRFEAYQRAVARVNVPGG